MQATQEQQLSAPSATHQLNSQALNRLTELRLIEMSTREQILTLLRDIDETKAYLEAGAKSLRQYCENELNYSPIESRSLFVQMGYVLTREQMTSSDPNIRRRIERLMAWRRGVAL